MKILYAIQGTGNGHLSRARDIIPLLQKYGDLDLLVSGEQADINLPYPVRYKFKGLGFTFGTKGGVDLMKTYKKSNIRRLLSEINSIPIESYDLIINDFEPVSAWACYINNKQCVALSHQGAVLNKHAPQPKHTDLAGKAILKYYAPATEHYGFHFKDYDTNIYTPVIRREIRDLQPTNKGHYTVYLPAYNDKRIIKVLRECKDTQWQVFSRHNKTSFTEKNISVEPVTNEAFINSMAGAAGVICGAGFETPAEAMFLQKKLLVIPMRKQYEQYCNASALLSMGVPVLKSLKLKHCDKIKAWLKLDSFVAVDYPDITSQVIATIINLHGRVTAQTLSIQPPMKITSVGTFKKLTLKKILAYIAT